MTRSIIVAGALLAASLAPAFAGPQDLQAIGESCANQLKLAPAVCSCMVDKAGTDLSSDQQAFMAAQIKGDAAEVARIQSTLTIEEATATGQFMSTVVGACGG